MPANRIYRCGNAVFLALALALFAPIATAQTKAAESAPTVGDIDDIQAQTFKQKAVLALASVNAELAKKGASDESVVPEVTAPNCSEVYGGKGLYKVIFLYSDGSQVTGRQGDTIPGGWRVTAVSLDKVQISRDGKSRDCGFSSNAPVPPPPRQMSPQQNFMPPPPIPNISLPPSFGH